MQMSCRFVDFLGEHSGTLKSIGLCEILELSNMLVRSSWGNVLKRQSLLMCRCLLIDEDRWPSLERIGQTPDTNMHISAVRDRILSPRIIDKQVSISSGVALVLFMLSNLRSRDSIW